MKCLPQCQNRETTYHGYQCVIETVTAQILYIGFRSCSSFWLLGAFVTHVPLPIHLPLSALQFVCPMIAAFILVSREEKHGGIKRLLKRVFDLKRIQPAIWYVPIILLNPLIMLLSYGVMLLMGRPLPEPYIPLLMIPVFFMVFFIPAACEEVGWMGYAVDPMQDRWSALTTGLILGLLWALWHVMPWLEANNLVWVAGQCFSTIGLRVLIIWLYNNTGKSVFAAIESDCCSFARAAIGHMTSVFFLVINV